MRYALAFLLVAFAFPVHSETIAGRASVIDGGAIEIQGIRIRLYGIDAPEAGQTCSEARKQWRCGQAAANALADKIGSHVVSCERKNRDRYGRILAVCRAGGEDLNGWMVSRGWAMAYRKHTKDYLPQEREAKRNRVGMWAGRFMAPYNWRRVHGVKKKRPLRRHCNIKGSISRNGKIYYLPSDVFYDRARINTSKGERWFCSESEARKAGWRRSKR